MNGSGMPVIGMMPIVMPMFSNTWNANSATNADADQRAEEVGRVVSGCSPDAPHQQREQAEQQRAADEAELLADRGEDEVGVLLGHERQLRELALVEALAPDAAVRDRRLRLAQRVLRVGEICARCDAVLVHERREPVEPVVLERAASR